MTSTAKGRNRLQKKGRWLENPAHSSAFAHALSPVDQLLPIGRSRFTLLLPCECLACGGDDDDGVDDDDDDEG